MKVESSISRMGPPFLDHKNDLKIKIPLVSLIKRLTTANMRANNYVSFWKNIWSVQEVLYNSTEGTVPPYILVCQLPRDEFVSGIISRLK